jgi:hypothetical protein
MTEYARCSLRLFGAFFSLFFFSTIFLSSLLLTSFSLLYERLTYGPSGTAITRFPGLMSRPLLTCFLCSLYWLLQSWTFVDLSSVLSPRASFPYRFPYVSLMVT